MKPLRIDSPGIYRPCALTLPLKTKVTRPSVPLQVLRDVTHSHRDNDIIRRKTRATSFVRPLIAIRTGLERGETIIRIIRATSCRIRASDRPPTHCRGERDSVNMSLCRRCAWCDVQLFAGRENLAPPAIPVSLTDNDNLDDGN